ncbi:hypothetical protein PO909_002910, partial [Leuciscus waleckii]
HPEVANRSVPRPLISEDLTREGSRWLLQSDKICNTWVMNRSKLFDDAGSSGVCACAKHRDGLDTARAPSDRNRGRAGLIRSINYLWSPMPCHCTRLRQLHQFHATTFVLTLM